MAESLTDFFEMGGYAFYVWSSYGIAFVVLVLNLVVPALNLRRVLRRLARQTRFERMQANDT